MSLEAFQDGGNSSHLGYCNGTILAILNLCYSNASHQVSAQSNLWFLRCRLKNFKMATLDIKWSNFCNSESLCYFYASHQVPAQSDLWFERKCPFKNFKMATVVAILAYWISEQNDLINSESPCSHNASHQVLAQSDLQFWRRCQQ